MQKIIFILVIVIFASSCSTALDVLYVINQPDDEAYDDGICKNGEPSEPGMPKRYGCVNDKSEAENKEAFFRYREEREIYLNDK